MKIKTESYLLIASITIIPVLVCVILLFSGQFEEKKWNKGLYRTAQKYYKSLNSNDWSHFSVDTDIIDLYNPSVAIIGKDRYVVYSSIPDVKPGSSFSDAAWQLLSQGASGYDNFVMSTRDFEKQLPDIFRTMPGYGTRQAVFFVRIPVENGLFASSSSREILLGGMILLLVCVIGISVRLIYTIGGTLSTISGATKNFAEGNYDREITVTGNDEICSLVKAFNKMRGEIRESALRKSHLIMGLSHDFKTPLALIQGYTEVIERETGLCQGNVGKYLGIISSKTEQLENMIDDLLDFVSLDAGEWPYSFDKVQFTGWISSFILRSRNDAALLGKTVVSSVHIPEYTSVLMDERLVERAFDNLVHNALRYTGEDGIVTIEVTSAKESLTVIISDNGPGIAKKDIPYIFDAFYRGSASRQTPGMGLGLSVVKSVMEAHNWTVSVESDRHRRTEFIITIPFAPLS